MSRSEPDPARRSGSSRAGGPPGPLPASTPGGDGHPETASPGARSAPRPPSRAAGLLHGIGLGGFVDGILLHQVLQWHHMVSHVEGYPTDTVAGLEANTLADGFFHVAAWLALVAASVLTISAWRRGRLAPSWSFHLGLVLAGWGLFNLVEGVVAHHLLGVHHVRDDLGAPLGWDLGFLAFGALLVAAGWLLHRHGAKHLTTQPPASPPAPGR